MVLYHNDFFPFKMYCGTLKYTHPTFRRKVSLMSFWYSVHIKYSEDHIGRHIYPNYYRSSEKNNIVIAFKKISM